MRSTGARRVILFACVIGAVIIYALYRWDGKLDNERYAKAQQEAEQAVARSVSQLGAKYNAVANWQESLPTKRPPFTAELTPNLVRSDRRPVLLIVSVRDVASSASAGPDSYSCTFLDDDISTRFSWDLQLALKCNSVQARRLMENSEHDYAIVAALSTVHLEWQPTENDDENEAQNRRFVAEGECLGLTPVTLMFEILRDMKDVRRFSKSP